MCAHRRFGRVHAAHNDVRQTKGPAMKISAKPVEVIATPLSDDEWNILVAIVGLAAAIGKASN